MEITRREKAGERYRKNLDVGDGKKGSYKVWDRGIDAVGWE